MHCIKYFKGHLFELQKLNSEEFEIFIYISNDAIGAGNVEAVINLESGLKIDVGTLNNLAFGTDLTLLNGRREFVWKAGNMTGIMFIFA